MTKLVFLSIMIPAILLVLIAIIFLGDSRRRPRSDKIVSGLFALLLSLSAVSLLGILILTSETT